MLEIEIKMYSSFATGVRLEFEKKEDGVKFMKHFYDLVRNSSDLYLDVSDKDEIVKKQSH